MTWLLVLNLVGLLLAVLLVLESFRRTPMWRRPEKSASPRQRRWLGIALIFIVAGNTVTVLNMSGRTNLGLLSFGLLGLGLVALVVGLVKGPTDEELERRARLLDQRG